MDEITKLISGISRLRISNALGMRGKYPDFIMINLEAKYMFKQYLARFGSDAISFDEKIDEMKIFGMQIIWTKFVELDKPICTYKSF